MKGYSTAAGYMGYVSWLGKYILFSTDEEYRDFLEDWGHCKRDRDVVQ